MSKRPLIMGVLNITPDSFSDGGAYSSLQKVLLQIEKLVEQGADIIDVGAESSRPGSSAVSVDEEWARLEPVLKSLDKWPEVIFSLDSYKDEIIERALSYKIDIINNIKGLSSKETLDKINKKKLSYISMHIHGELKTMQESPISSLQESKKVLDILKKDFQVLKNVGFSEDRIFLDPGIGFGKDDRANLLLLKMSMEKSKKLPLLVGVSRKSFIGRLLDIDQPLMRDNPSKMLEICLMMAGVKIIRTHAVEQLAKMRDLIYN